MGGNENIKMDLKRHRMREHGLYSSGSGQEQVAGCCAHGNELF